MPRKIAIVIPGFQASPHDWCIPVFTNLARELAGHAELHIFALRYPHRRDNYLIGNVHVHSLWGGAIAGKRVPVASLLNLWRSCLSRIVGEHKKSPFAAIMGVWATESGWLATRAAQRCEVPSLVHVAGGELTWIPDIGYGNWGRGLAGLLVKSALRAADTLTAPSETIRQTLLGVADLDQHKVKYWAPGIDTSMFSPGPTRTESRKSLEFVTAGSLIPVKGHDLLLRALALVRQRRPDLNVRLKVIGDGPLRHELARLASGLGLAGYVAFVGEVSHDRLPDLYRSSDAFLLGSWHESQCMAAIEAMSCALPWIGPPIGALAEIDRDTDGQSGVLFRGRDPEAVAQAILTISDLADEERARWGILARRRVVERYSMDRQGEVLLQILERELTQH